MPVPATPGNTVPAVGVVDGPLEQARVIEVAVTAVSTKVAVRPVLDTVAVIDTLPAAVPSVTCVFATPPVSVVAVAGDTLAAPPVTANDTDAPFTAAPFAL